MELHMSELMTISEIKKRFDKKWVLIENPTRSKDDKLKSGTVLGSSKDRHRVYKKIGQFKPRHFAIVYIGERPKDVVYML